LRDLVSGGLDSSCDPGALRDEIEDHLWREFAARVHPGTAVAAL
jgi:hypothetical protein